MNPAAEVQNFAVLFRFHKFQGFDPLSMNGRAMNRNRSRPIHRGCTHAQAAQPYFCEFWIVSLIFANFGLFPYYYSVMQCTSCADKLCSIRFADY
jgi:hypothetical protein